MVKHTRKKQKISKHANPLGSVRFSNEADKDDEERRLESLLFGTDFIADEKGKGRDEGNVIISGEEDVDNGLYSLDQGENEDVRRDIFLESVQLKSDP